MDSSKKNLPIQNSEEQILKNFEYENQIKNLRNALKEVLKENEIVSLFSEILIRPLFLTNSIVKS